MTGQDSLVEQAAKVIAGMDWLTSMHLEKARAVLSLFEKAHTPKDDEREALARTIYLWDVAESVSSTTWEDLLDTQRDVWLEGADSVLAAGFRRTEVPEPSAPTDVRGRSRGKHTDAQMLYMICLALEEGLEGVANVDLPDLIIKMISEHWGTADEDSSPEEAEAALAQLAPYIPDHMRTPEPQGEPSDAQVEDAWWRAMEAGELPRPRGDGTSRKLFEAGYRAALRAAGVEGVR